MNLNSIFIGMGLFFLGQTITFAQLNFQFIYPWFKNNTFLLSLLGVPVSFIFIYATKFSVNGFNGELWPSRFLGFAAGIIIYAILTKIFFGQSFDLKTTVSLVLAFMLIFIQTFWK
jgi:hypothetical protein